MNQTHLESFIVVAECGSISAAAKRLYLSPSSLLQQINLLEAECGFAVFTRSKKGVELTPAGGVLYERATRIMAETSAMLDACRQVAESEDNTIHLALFAPYPLMKLAHAFQESHPSIKLECVAQGAKPVTADLFAKLLDGTFDVVECGIAQAGVDERIGLVEVATRRVCCLCAPAHPLSTYEVVTATDLAPYEVYTCKTMSDVLKRIEAHAAQEGVGLRLNKMFYSDEAVIACCERGGIFLGTDQQAPLFGHLRFIPFEPEFLYHSCLAYLKDGRPATRMFIESVRPLCAPEPRDAPAKPAEG